MGETATSSVDRKGAIISAAHKVFATYGFDAGTIRQIALEAGVAEGLIYHYFENKDALLDAVIRERSILSWLDRPDALREDVPVEIALRELIGEALDRMAQNADVIALAWSQAVLGRSEGRLVGRTVRQITDRLAGYLERKISRGELRPIDTAVAARVIAASLIMFTLAQHRLSPPLKHLAVDHYADMVVDIIMSGLRALPPGEGEDESSSEG
jgi:AcrR family transcriptional regulator